MYTIDSLFPVPIYKSENNMIDEIPLIEKACNDFLLEHDIVQYAHPNNPGVSYFSHLLVKPKVMMQQYPFTILADEILKQASVFIEALGYDEYVRDNVSLDMWINKGYKGDYVQRHIHIDSHVTGVFYVKADGVTDAIKLYRTKTDVTKRPSVLNDLNRNVVECSIKSGDLIMFRSSTEHCVEKQISDERIAIPFNIRFK